VIVDPDGGSGWDEPPLDIQIPDDARELDRDVLAYRRELRAQRRRRRLRRLAGHGTIMPLLASILAVCLVAGAMLSVATFSPAPGVRPTPTATTSASQTAPRASQPAKRKPSPAPSASGTAARRASSSPSPSSSARTRTSAPSTRASGPAR
jgi:cell division septation protein DedD